MEAENSEQLLQDSQKKKKILYMTLIGLIIFVVLLAIILGLVFGLKKDDNDDDDDVEIVDSYDNTEELIKKYPVINPTTVQDGLEKKIQNRLLTGFENWNRGYKAWKKWGDILYTKDSIYNVNGVRLSLEQYQSAMDVSLKKTNILLGNFYNMIINGQYIAIFYDDIKVINGKKVNGTVMEFVLFKDYEGKLGTRVVVGWGGTKGSSFDSMRVFQGDDEKMVQDEKIHLLNNYQIPTSVANLKEKYPILYPTEYLDNDKAKIFTEIILEGFDKWNTDLNSYIEWLSIGYFNDAISCGLEGEERNMTEYINAIKELTNKQDIKKLYFYNILVRDNWAAIHYQYRSEDKVTKEKYVGDRMQFFKFKEEGNTYKIEASWVK